MAVCDATICVPAVIEQGVDVCYTYIYSCRPHVCLNSKQGHDYFVPSYLPLHALLCLCLSQRGPSAASSSVLHDSAAIVRGQVSPSSATRGRILPNAALYVDGRSRCTAGSEDQPTLQVPCHRGEGDVGGIMPGNAVFLVVWRFA